MVQKTAAPYTVDVSVEATETGLLVISQQNLSRYPQAPRQVAEHTLESPTTPQLRSSFVNLSFITRILSGSAKYPSIRLVA